MESDPNGAYLRSFEERNRGYHGWMRIKTSVIRVYPRPFAVENSLSKRHSNQTPKRQGESRNFARCERIAERGWIPGTWPRKPLAQRAPRTQRGRATTKKISHGDVAAPAAMLLALRASVERSAQCIPHHRAARRKGKVKIGPYLPPLRAAPGSGATSPCETLWPPENLRRMQ
jgi:hypothetical protein